MTPPGKIPKKKQCGAKKRGGGKCELAKGFGTDHPGTGSCKFHGGSTPSGRKSAKRKAVTAEAQRMVRLAGVDQDPIEHLLESLHQAKALVEVWGAMVAELDEVADEENADAKTRGELGYEQDTDQKSPYELEVRSKDRLLALDRHGQAGVHPFVAEYQQAIERRAKLAKMCLDAGIEQRQVELYEQQVEIAHTAFEASLDALELSAEQKKTARKAYAERLRSAA